MDNPNQKRFNLIDAIVLVAATAVGLALGREVSRWDSAYWNSSAIVAVGLAIGREVSRSMQARSMQGPGTPLPGDIIQNWVVSVALTWSIAILALNLTRYRTTRRELACRPGFTAVVAICVDRVFDFFYGALTTRFFGGLTCYDLQSLDSVAAWVRELSVREVVGVVHGSSSTAVVAAVWLIMGMAGCWRAEKTWIDRTGRALGVFWLLVMPCYRLSVWISSFYEGAGV